MFSRYALPFALLLAACEKKEAPTPPAAVPPPSADKAAAPQATATPPPAGKATTGYVLYGVALKKEPSDKAKLPDPKDASGKKQVSNWLATLYRGEKVTLIKEDGDYEQVKTSGDIEGWLKKTSLLMEPDVVEATVLESTDAFDRPDLLAINAKKKIDAGTLIFQTKTKEQFSEVSSSGTGKIWVLSGKLTTDTNEIAVAKLLAKAKGLKDPKEIEALVNLAKGNFGSAKLVEKIDELAKPAEAGEGEPASAPAAAANP